MIGNWRPVSLGRMARHGAESACPYLWRNLVGLWLPCVGRAGDKIRDWSQAGSSAVGTMTNMDGTDWQQSPIGPCLDFDGTNDYLAFTAATAARLETTTGLTVFAVLRLNASQTTRNVVNRAQGGGTVSGWGVGVSDSSANRLKFYTATAAGAGHNLDGSTALTTGQWHACGWVYNPTLLKEIYLDGKLDGTVNPGHTLGYTSCLTAIGRYEGGASQYLNGSIALIAVWSRQLVRSEMHRLAADPLHFLRRRPRSVGLSVAGSYNPALGCFDEPEIWFPRATYLGV